MNLESENWRPEAGKWRPESRKWCPRASLRGQKVDNRSPKVDNRSMEEQETGTGGGAQHEARAGPGPNILID